MPELSTKSKAMRMWCAFLEITFCLQTRGKKKISQDTRLTTIPRLLKDPFFPATIVKELDDTMLAKQRRQKPAIGHHAVCLKTPDKPISG